MSELTSTEEIILEKVKKGSREFVLQDGSGTFKTTHALSDAKIVSVPQRGTNKDVFEFQNLASISLATHLNTKLATLTYPVRQHYALIPKTFLKSESAVVIERFQLTLYQFLLSPVYTREDKQIVFLRTLFQLSTTLTFLRQNNAFVHGDLKLNNVGLNLENKDGCHVSSQAYLFDFDFCTYTEIRNEKDSEGNIKTVTIIYGPIPQSSLNAVNDLTAAKVANCDTLCFLFSCFQYTEETGALLEQFTDMCFDDSKSTWSLKPSPKPDLLSAYFYYIYQSIHSFKPTRFLNYAPFITLDAEEHNPQIVLLINIFQSIETFLIKTMMLHFAYSKCIRNMFETFTKNERLSNTFSRLENEIRKLENIEPIVDSSFLSTLVTPDNLAESAK